MPHPADPTVRASGEQAQAEIALSQGPPWDLDGHFTRWWFTDCWCPQASSFAAPQSPSGALAKLFRKFDFQTNF